MIKPKPLAAFAVLVVCLYFFSPTLARYIQKPFEKTLFNIRIVLKKSFSVTDFMKSIPLALQDKKMLRSQVQKLQAQLIELEELRIENIRLRSLFGFQSESVSGIKKGVVANVVGRSVADWHSVIMIDKGSLHGIEKDMPVITAQGLIGKTAEVEKKYCKVKLLTHPGIKVGVLIQRTRHTGVAYGRLDDEIRMKYISLDADVMKGDIVETAGYSSAFPKGIPIGVVDEIWKETGQVYKVASIKPFADINRLEEVICVRKH